MDGLRISSIVILMLLVLAVQFLPSNSFSRSILSAFSSHRRSTILKGSSDSAVTESPFVNCKIAIVKSLGPYESEMANIMKGVDDTLAHAKVASIGMAIVPSILEFPIAAKAFVVNSAPDAILCVGCQVNDEYARSLGIPSLVTEKLLQLSIDSQKPCIPGIHLTKVKRPTNAGVAKIRKNRKAYLEAQKNATLVSFGSSYAKLALSMALGNRDTYSSNAAAATLVHFAAFDAATSATTESPPAPSVGF